jgi:hypothetical protein
MTAALLGVELWMPLQRQSADLATSPPDVRPAGKDGPGATTRDTSVSCPKPIFVQMQTSPPTRSDFRYPLAGFSLSDIPVACPAG